jgi:hypothetical protein
VAKYYDGYKPGVKFRLTELTLFALVEFIHRPRIHPMAPDPVTRASMEREIERREYLNKECGRTVTK